MMSEQSIQNQQRLIRVFVSSTFRDMQAERDELGKFIFPQLRKLCEQRGVTWVEVDLRWGITDEQQTEGKVLPICLDEVQRCRPFFIGLLGERYGWIPDEIPDELAEREPWLAAHRGRSVTELEIFHGVLNNPAMAEHALFYFRDQIFIDTLSVAERPAFQEYPTPDEITKYGEIEAMQRAEERKEKLQSLKQSIRKTGLPVKENYRDAKQLGKWVLSDMTAIIDRLYPEGSQLTPLNHDAIDHDVFAQTRARIYIGREEYIDHLDDFVQSDTQPLVVLGESGAGKSALLANWAIHYRRQLAEKRLSSQESVLTKLAFSFQKITKEHQNSIVLMHFIGATPDSADWAAMLRRIMGELKQKFDIQEDIPEKRDALCTVFANWLHMAAARGRVVLILDGLNQLEDSDGAPDLVWLPPVIPTNVRLIVSTLPGRPLNEIVKRGWRTLRVESLTVDERQRLIKEYLGQYTKTLSSQQIEHIANSSQAANPLYLRTLLEELRLFGIYEQLDEQINYYLEAESVDTLYDRILTRYETDYEQERPGLVRDAMSLLWTARHGLSEIELMELLGTKDALLPHAYWSPLYLAAEQALINRTGFITFSHEYMRQAVQNRYLPTEKDQQTYHLRLADYFAARDIDKRKIDELPWQLTQAREWQSLFSLLANMSFLRVAFTTNEFDFKEFWTKVEANSKLRVIDAYDKLLTNPEADANDTLLVGMLLGDLGYPKEALAFQENRTRHFQKSGDQINLAGALGNQAVALAAVGELAKAMQLYKEQERLCREVTYDIRGLATCLLNQSNILFLRGELDQAMRFCGEAQEVFRRLTDKQGIATCLNVQAQILVLRGNFNDAMLIYKEEERIARELANKSMLATCLHNQAEAQYSWHNLDVALALEKESAQICQELGFIPGLIRSLVNQGKIIFETRDDHTAMQKLEEAANLCREREYKVELPSVLLEEGNVMMIRGNLNAAEHFFIEAEHMCSSVGDMPGLVRSLGSQGHVHKARGDLDRALELHKRVEQLSREIDDKLGLLSALTNESNILFSLGDKDTMFNIYKEMVELSEVLGDKRKQALSIANMANILTERDKFDDAIVLHKKAEAIFRELGDREGISKSIYNQTEILKSQRNTISTLKRLQDEETQLRNQGKMQELADCLHNQAMIFSNEQGNQKEAMKLYKEKENICRKIGYGKGLATSLTNQAVILTNQGNFTAALPLLEEAHVVAYSSGMSSFALRLKSMLDSLKIQAKMRR